MAQHLFVANAPGVIQTTRGRYRIEAAGDILKLSEAEAVQVRSATFAERNLLTYLGEEETSQKRPAAKAVPTKKKKAEAEAEVEVEAEAAPLGE